MNKKPIERRRAGLILSAIPESPLLVKPLSDPATLLDRLVLTLALAPCRASARRKTQASSRVDDPGKRGEVNRG